MTRATHGGECAWFDVLDAACELLLGGACPVCGAPGRQLCGRCRVALASGPLALLVDDLPVSASGAYEGELRTALVRYKERGAHPLQRPLGGLLAEAVAALLPDAGPWALIPMPSSPDTVRERGLDVTHALARRAAAVLAARGVDVTAVRGLCHGRTVADQSGLTLEGRHANVAGSMRVRLRGPPVRCILVDDITTSGATLLEGARALQAAGRPVAGAAVVAATPRRLGGG